MASDPPFSRLDLISCRNVLVYMDVPLQQRVPPAFHYALNPDGFLLLGGSENIGSSDIFEPVDARQRIFAKRPAPGGVLLDFGRYTPAGGEARRGDRPGRVLW